MDSDNAESNGSASDAPHDASWLDSRFEDHRDQLRAVAYRMLGSLTEADDAVQDTWLRVHLAGSGDVDNIGGWLMTALARVCLNMLRSGARRREEPLEFHVPDPVVLAEAQHSPESAALLADSIGLALLVVLDTLTPPERLAFVMHDLFDLPYEQIAKMVDRTPVATRQLASRARRRVHDAALPAPDRYGSQQRRVVDAFFTAARDGDLATLAALLDPDAVLRIDAGPTRPSVNVAFRGAEAVAAQTVRGLASALRQPAVELHPARVNGSPGVVATVHGRPISIIGFAFTNGRITEIDAVADPGRVQSLAEGFTSDAH
jgi:RNA polymerase sigma-70 factor, ECF subfamily